MTHAKWKPLNTNTVLMWSERGKNLSEYSKSHGHEGTECDTKKE